MDETAEAPAWAVRALDVAFGLTALSWCVRGLVSHGSEPAGLALAGLNGVAGLLFLVRRRPVEQVRLEDNVLCLGSVVMSAVALQVAPDFAAWPSVATWLFVLGGIAASISILSLGQSFGVFPARRGLVQRGPFALLRHPIYACELCMVAACGLASGSFIGLWPLLVTLPLVVVRIGIEERLLAEDPDHAAYRARVRWRLVPGIW